MGGLHGEYEGPNLAHVEPDHVRFDMHCPLMGGHKQDNNYYRDRCEMRQRDNKMKDCYNGCKAERALNVSRKSMHGAGKFGVDSNLIFRLFEQGLTTKQVAKKVNRAKCTIGRYRAKYELAKAMEEGSNK